MAKNKKVKEETEIVEEVKIVKEKPAVDYPEELGPDDE